MCSWLQKHIDWWLWITEQSVRTSPSHRAAHSPHVLAFLFVKVEHCHLFCCANILLTLGDVMEDEKLMTAVVLLVYALLSPRSCMMSHIWGLSLSAPAHNKKTQINNKNLIKAWMSRNVAYSWKPLVSDGKQPTLKWAPIGWPVIQWFTLGNTEWAFKGLQPPLRAPGSCL